MTGSSPQIRQGKARGPAMRTGKPISGNPESVKQEFGEILDKAFGPGGDVIRKNAQEVAKELRAERDGRAESKLRELSML